MNEKRINNLNVLVTGSRGFVGNHLVRCLEKGGAKVCGVDRKNGIDISNWKEIKGFKDIEIDVVFHLAASVNPTLSWKESRKTYKNNIDCTLNILEVCKSNKARLVYISSYVYGVPKYVPIDENHPISLRNPYTNSKILCEMLCQAYSNDFGIKTIIIRPFNIFGPGQNRNFLIPTIISQINTGKVILNDPIPKRDFLYIDDFTDALVKLLFYNGPDHEIFNIGFGKSYSVKEIVELILNISNTDVEVVYKNVTRKDEVLDITCDNNKAKTMLKWKPGVNFEEGIKRMLKASHQTRHGPDNPQKLFLG